MNNPRLRLRDLNMHSDDIEVWYVDELTEEDDPWLAGGFGVFHIDTGFCKATYFCEKQALRKAEELNEELRRK